MGELVRKFWLPFLQVSDVAEPDGPPVRVTLLGEQLVAFRDTSGRIGLIDRFCAHRCANLFFGRNEENGLRAPTMAGSTTSKEDASTCPRKMRRALSRTTSGLPLIPCGTNAAIATGNQCNFSVELTHTFLLSSYFSRSASG